MENTNNKANDSLVKNVVTVPTKETVTNIKHLIINGEISPAYAGVILKKFAKIAEEVKKDKEVTELIENDTKSFQEGTIKTFHCYGAKITIANRGYWDYSKTDDPLLNKLQEIEKDIAERIKNRKAELQLKTDLWEKDNKPKDKSTQEAFGESTEKQTKFGIRPFNVSWEALPELTWEEGYGETDTNPPIKRSTEQLRYSV